MAVKNISNCLQEEFGIPYDVRFLFEEKGGRKEVNAHKLVLSLGSEVFKREFYGSINDPVEGILIVDASQKVFEAMVKFIYNKKMSWCTFSFNFLAELYYLGDKYDIQDLKNELIESIATKRDTLENILEVAFLGESNILFPTLSAALYLAAATVLKKKFKHRIDHFVSYYHQTVASYGITAELSKTVLDKIIEQLKLLSHCSNCKQDPCQHGLGITEENFVPGSRVQAAGRGRGDPDLYRLGEVVDSTRFTGFNRYEEVMEHCSLNSNLYVYNCSSDYNQGTFWSR